MKITATDILTSLRSEAGEPEIAGDAEQLLDTSLDDLGYDSLAVIGTATALRTKFGKVIEDKDLVEAHTLRDLVDLANAS